MHQAKFLTLLATLTEAEAHEFLKYVKKTHAKGKVSHKLLTDVLKFIDDGNGNKILDIEYAQKKAFDKKGTSVPKKKIQNTLSEISQWLEEFLLIQKVLPDSFERQVLWLSVLQDRKPGQLFLRSVDQIDGMLMELKQADVKNLMKRMFLGHLRYFGQDYDNLNEDDSALGSYENQLDQFYFVAKLKILCERLNRAKVHGTKVPLTEIEAQAASYADKSPLVTVYLDTYRFLSHWDHEFYQKAETSLKQYCDDIAPSETTRVIDYLQNYAGAEIRNGRQNLWHKIHELDVLCVEKDWLKHHEGMSVTKFVNMVTAAIRVGAINWALQFVEQQSHILPSKLRSLGITLASAFISLEQKDYSKALELLTPLSRKTKEIPNIQEKTRVMLLFIQASYELDNPEGSLLDYCISCESNLRNTYKSNLKAAESIMNFISIVKLLLRKKESREVIVKCINDTASLSLRDWLMKKADDYKM